MKQIKQWALIGLMAGVWVVQVDAQMPPMGGSREHRPGSGMREGSMRGGHDESGFQDILRDSEMVQALKLDEGQIEKIKALTTQFKKEMIDWNAKLQHAALAQVDLMEQAEPVEGAVLKVLDETGLIHTEIAKLRVKHLFAVRAILTPEQRQQARELLKAKMSERRKMGEKKAGKGFEHGAPPCNPPGKPDDANRE